jgi:hypothetical protein
MKRISNRTAGFSSLEAMLILVILGIIGFVGWYVWHTKQSTDKAYTAASSSANQSQQPSGDKSKGTKHYVNEEYGFSFDYPDDWTIAIDLKDIGRGSNEGDVVVTSPKGTKVHFGPGQGGKGGDCFDPETDDRTTKTCSTLNVLSAEKLSTGSASRPVYFYHMSLTAPTNDGGKTVYYVTIMNNDAIPTKPGSLLGVVLYPYDEIYLEGKGYVTVYVDGAEDAKDTSGAYFQTNQVKEATPVLRSFKIL